ncbi:amino acid adenylation domain-containing protein [Streptomyces sp. NPDC097619]|uniref:amino acid adenylation domain-containing protein n=1 Tax=Streptomyces sp. NPDC097619 TaxID=3157228 RepID=UPI0033323DE9
MNPTPPAPGPAAAPEYPRDATLHGLFLRQAAATPEAVAVEDAHSALTYAALADRSARLAARLVAHGVRPGDLVAVRAERSPAWITANLAVLRAGAGYLPVGPAEPELRVAALLDDAGVRVVLGDRDARLPDGRVLLAIDGPADAEATHGAEAAEGADGAADGAGVLPDPETVPGPEGLAYVMYTSGSTGHPKGVMVGHRNVVRLVRGTGPGRAYVDFGPHTRVLQTGAATFDASTFEVWGPLLNGGTVVLPEEDAVLDADRLAATLRRHAVTTLWLTSPLFSRLVRQDPALFAPLTELLVGGDVVVGEDVAAVLAAAPALRVVNGYGPTENTTFSTTHVITPEDTGGPLPIGRPVAHSTAQVLDPEGAPVPPGRIGELFVGGDGVALGYLGRPELTEAAFRPDPTRPGGRLYRTGDLVRERPDGVLEFHGRADGQVKIRGYRVEPGEIEAVLRAHPDVAEAVVVPRVRPGGDPADRYLAAYYTEVVPTDPRELREHLAERLPRHLLPGHLVPLDALPLTAHGKTDRAALPDPADLFHLPAEHVPPRDTTEERLVALWEAALPGATVGVLDSAFDHGVDSLLAAGLATAIGAAFGTPVTVADVFRNPTVEELALLLAERAPGPAAPAGPPPAPPADHYPLAPQQYPLFVAQSRDPRTVQYNVPLLLELPADTDPDRLAAAWHALVRRHEVLRTSFHLLDEPVQRVDPGAGGELAVTTGEPDLAALVRPFDLSVPPLARAVLHTREDAPPVLFTDLHHLVADGLSLGRLFGDLDALYRGEELPPVALPYRDYAHWAAAGEGKELAERQRGFWTTAFEGRPAPVELPTDRPRPADRSNAGDLLPFSLGPERTAALRAFAARRGTTLLAPLAAAHAVFLARVTGQYDLTTGIPAAGRTAAGLDGAVGMFVNTVCLRLAFAPDTPFTELTARAAEASREALAHQDLPYGELVREAAAEPVPGRNPLFDTLLALQAGALQTAEFLGTPVLLRPRHTGQGMADLNLQVFEEPEDLYCEWEYATELFDRATVAAFRDTLLDVLDRALADPAAPVGAPAAPVDTGPAAAPEPTGLDFAF